MIEDEPISFRLLDRDYSEDLQSQLHFENDIDSVNVALVEHSKVFAHWLMLENAAREEAESKKNELALLEAKLFEVYETKLSQEQDKKPTLDKIKGKIIRNTKHVALKQEVAKSQSVLSRITVGRQALQSRKDCLIELARNMRAEMEYNLSVPKTPIGRVELAKKRANDFRAKLAKTKRTSTN
jgi:hypothetical protein